MKPGGLRNYRTVMAKGTLTGALVVGIAFTGAALANSTPVTCYDEARSIITQSTAKTCSGRIVSTAEAGAIQARFQQRRLQHTNVTGGRQELRENLIGYGTGFVVSPTGGILTSLHTVDGCGHLTVLDRNLVRHGAVVVGYDGSIDVALLQADFEPLSVATIFPGKPPGHGTIKVVGYPDMEGTDPILPVDGYGLVPDFLTTSQGHHIIVQADIEPGHSGSPVFDTSGNVLGLIRVKWQAQPGYSTAERPLERLALAVSAPMLRDFLRLNGVKAKTDQPFQPDGDNSVLRVECRDGD